MSEPRESGHGSTDAGPAPVKSPDEVRAFVIAWVAKMTGLAEREVDVTASLSSLGVDSVHAVELAFDLEEQLGVPVPDTLTWTHPNVNEIVSATTAAAEPEPTAASAAEPTGGAAPASTAASATGPRSQPTGSAAGADTEPIAIVGIGCRFPGADGKEAFWDLLCGDTDPTVPVPASRWDADAMMASAPGEPGRIATKEGGFLPDVENFDAEFFGLSPAEAAATDPQQRIFLEVVWQALEDAGVPFDSLAGSATGVFAGMFAVDYATRFGSDPVAIDPHFGAGNSLNGPANRVSYTLDLRGPSVTTTAVCASSLITADDACASLRRGESSMAVAGGVNLILEPHTSVWFSQIGVLSPDGRCKSFSTEADGLARSEGAGAVVLKRLSDAVADGDHVYALVRGGAVSHNGRGNGITSPNPAAQTSVVRAALERSGLRARDLDLVEAHGTGTLLGDRIELEALRSLMGEDRPAEDPCLIGTVKSIIGHSESAGGIAGIIKAALALDRDRIPAHRVTGTADPAVERAGLSLVTEARPWPSEGADRVVGVSAFAVGGSNAHVVLSGAPRSEAGTIPAPPAADRAHVLRLSAATPSALSALATAHLDRLAGLPADLLDTYCWHTTVTRARLGHNAVVIAHTGAELQKGLRAIVDDPEASSTPRTDAPSMPYVVRGRSTRGNTPRVAMALGGDADPRELEATALWWRWWGVEPVAIVGEGPGEKVAAKVNSEAPEGVWTPPTGVSLKEGLAEAAALGCDTVLVFGSATVDEQLAALPSGGLNGAALPSQEALESLAALEVLGTRVRWAEALGQRPRGRAEPPGYPFERQRHWVERPSTPGKAGGVA